MDQNPKQILDNLKIILSKYELSSAEKSALQSAIKSVEFLTSLATKFSDGVEFAKATTSRRNTSKSK